MAELPQVGGSVSDPVPKPSPGAIASAEELLRRLKTGELAGFVAVATGPDDLAGIHRGGRLDPTTTVCMLEHLKLLVLRDWTEGFEDSDGAPSLGVVEDSPDPEAT